MPEARAPQRRTRGKPTPVDRHVGARVRALRTLGGMSQSDLAEALGLTFQQVQKYERGANRIGAGRLYDLARVFEVPVAAFYEGLGGTDGEPLPELNRRETLTFVRKIGCLGKQRRAMVSRFVDMLAEEEGAADGR